MEKVFFRNIVALCISFSMLRYKKQPLWGHRKNRKMLILRGVLGSLGIITYFYSIDHLILADSSMLNKLSPFFVILFAWMFLKNPIRPIQIISVFLALTGSLLIIKPGFEFSSTMPALIGLSSAVIGGLAYTVVSYLGDKENSYTIVFYFSLISTIFCLPFLLIDFVLPTITQTLLLLTVGTFAAGGQFLLTVSFKYARAGDVSIYQYTQIVVASILGIIFFAELPDAYSLLGYVLIFSAGYLMYWISKRESVVIPQDTQ
jgi:drug/metabolite transporter (DMT)-like permease